MASRPSALEHKGAGMIVAVVAAAAVVVVVVVVVVVGPGVEVAVVTTLLTMPPLESPSCLACGVVVQHSLQHQDGCQCPRVRMAVFCKVRTDRPSS